MLAVVTKRETKKYGQAKIDGSTVGGSDKAESSRANRFARGGCILFCSRVVPSFLAVWFVFLLQSGVVAASGL